MYVNLVEPESIQALLKVLKPGDVFFDVGANIGYYTILASRQVGRSGRVVAFEPLVRNVSFLHRHVALNSARNVTIIPMACSARAELAALAVGDSCATASLADRNVSGGDPATEYAGTVTLDEVIDRLSLVPNVLKIDVEGAELDVLTGAAKTLASARPSILLSVHSPALRSTCTTLLRDLGYGQPVVCSELQEGAELLFAGALAPALDVGS